MAHTHFYFDENLSEYVAASINVIEEVRGDFVVESTINCVGRSATDEEIVNYLESQEHECVLITNDSDFSKRNLLTQIMKSNNIGLFVIRFGKGNKFWDKYVHIVRVWKEIRDTVAATSTPFSYHVSANRKITKI